MSDSDGKSEEKGEPEDLGRERRELRENRGRATGQRVHGEEPEEEARRG